MTRRPQPVTTAATVIPQVHRARDHPSDEIRRAVRDGRWQRVTRGAYVDAGGPGGRYERERAVALAHVAAVVSRLSTPSVVTHESAALVWGLPLLHAPTAVHVAQRRSPSAHTAPDVVRHVMDIPPGHVTTHDGIVLTTLERTMVDCARSLGPAGGLVVADGALHRGADLATCSEIVAQLAGRRGVRTARAVLAVADDGAESAGETLARLAVVRLGVAPPTTQVAVRTHLGIFWCDLGWPAWRVVLEYDGVAKYAATGSAPDVVLREKRREDALREAGWTVLRLTRADLRDPGLLLRRLRDVLPPEAFGHAVDPYLAHNVRRR